MRTPWDDARRQRDAAARIARALADARYQLDELDETPVDGFTDLHYAMGYSAMEVVLRELVEACELIDWSRSGATDPDADESPVDEAAHTTAVKEVAGRYPGLYPDGYLDRVRNPPEDET